MSSTTPSQLDTYLYNTFTYFYVKNSIPAEMVSKVKSLQENYATLSLFSLKALSCCVSIKKESTYSLYRRDEMVVELIIAQH